MQVSVCVCLFIHICMYVYLFVFFVFTFAIQTLWISIQRDGVIFFCCSFCLFRLKLFEFHVLHSNACMFVCIICNMSSLNSHIRDLIIENHTRTHVIQNKISVFFLSPLSAPTAQFKHTVCHVNLCTSWTHFPPQSVSLFSRSIHLLLMSKMRLCVVMTHETASLY